MAVPPIIPWEPCNIPDEIQAELNRRKVNRSFRYVKNDEGGWDSQTGEWTKYRGPMTPWVRLCSNGAGRYNIYGDEYDRQGFVFFGGKGFYNEYGFGKLWQGDESNRSIIGYMPDGKTPHIVYNDLKTSNFPIHVPPPEIEKITCTIQKELFRRASVEWVCFSKAQLEYMTPYFLVPGISCILEFGWNLFNSDVLLNLDDIDTLKAYNCNPYPLYTEHILRSKGNYDVLFGRITHFEWAVDGNKFRCKTEITSQDRIYSGLVIDSKAEVRVVNEGGDEKETRPFGSLLQFTKNTLPQFKSIATSQDAKDSKTPLGSVVAYIRQHHPNNADEYLNGVFYGRDPSDIKSTDQYDNKKEDFDRKSQKDLWVNLGLLMECINFFPSPLKSLCGKSEIFRVDIDDVVINGHPNLISCDGSVLLIPNAMAPKYFRGLYGFNSKEARDQSKNDYDILKNSTITPTKDAANKKDAADKKKLYDWRLFNVCRQIDGIYRDDLDELINRVRYSYGGKKLGDNAFPFKSPKTIVPNQEKPYPAMYSGLLRDLYVNVAYFTSLLETESVKTYVQLIQKMMQDISDAAGGFWDFRLVSGTGKKDDTGPATMKIVDYKFVNTANRGTPYTFDYFDADSLLLGISFKPTLSNAQAIRTIYAQTNQPDKNVVLTNGDNELLDYMFKDRLAMDNDNKSKTPPPQPDTNHDETMRVLQQISPSGGSYQMTTRVNGKIVLRRLALPAPDVLKMLLDDGDEENNPKYTGIMPGIQAQFTVQGIGGLRTFMMFLVRNLPEPYSHENIVFRIVDIQDSIEAGKWTTQITAGIIPLRDHIKVRLGIPLKSS